MTGDRWLVLVFRRVRILGPLGGQCTSRAHARFVVSRARTWRSKVRALDSRRASFARRAARPSARLKTTSRPSTVVWTVTIARARAPDEPSPPPRASPQASSRRRRRSSSAASPSSSGFSSSCLLPRVETAAALVPIQRRLLAAATPSHVDPSRLVVTPDVAAQCMGVSLSSVAHVLEVLASVQPREPSSSSSAAAASSSDREILVQDLLQYLFLQAYARPHAQSLLRESTAQEAPFADPLDAAAFLGAPVSPVPSPGPRSPAATGAASPGAGTSPKGSPAKSRTASREWQRAEAEALQAQFVVHHFHALCGLLVEDEAKIGTGGQGGCLLELTPREADRLAFLFQTNATGSPSPKAPGVPSRKTQTAT